MKTTVYCLMSDGDMNEGSTWEAVIFAAQHKLSGLTGIIDYNRVQALFRTFEEHSQPGTAFSPSSRISAGRRHDEDGHDFAALEDAFSHLPSVSKSRQ